uniref:GSCFA domain-containing protein n=1 Tax=Alistipes sp. TaxID=1872444 RepID=UPI0040579048
MKLRTEFPIRKLTCEIDYNSRIVSLGSCFAESISGRLKADKFSVVINPIGVMFNPLSIARTIVRFAENRPLEERELRYDEKRGLWFHYDLHGSFSAPQKELLLERSNLAIEAGHRALKEADTLILTFGTAFAYRLIENQTIVANCHKQPQGLFQREMLSVEKIVSTYKSLINHELKGKRILFTLSPIRHLREGAEENSLSKALLRVAIAGLKNEAEGIDYFPAWELMMDDLRDYRFYAEDLLHPSSTAVEYLWGRFREVALKSETQGLQEEVERLIRTLQHRPLHPQSPASQHLFEELKRRIAELEARIGLRFEEEKRLLSERFQ